MNYPKAKTLQICITDFQNGLDTKTAENITEFNRAVEAYNFDYKSGALTESLGFEDLTLPFTSQDGSAEGSILWQEGIENSVIKKIAHYKQFFTNTNSRIDKIILISGNNNVFFGRIVTEVPSFVQLDKIQYTKIPKMFNYTDGTYDAIIFTNEADGLNSWNGQVATKHYEYAPVVADMCIYKGRTFAVIGGERLTIRTEPMNLFLWTVEPSTINTNITLDSERGYINRLLAFNGYMYAIRDFGITRITWYESDNSYAVSEVLCAGSKMYADTACICGNKGIVLCKDGLYQFNNIVAEKLDLKLDRMLNGVANSNAVGAFRNGVYYLACRLNFCDDKKIGVEVDENYKNNALISLDVATNKYSILRGIDICDLCTIQHESADKLLACFNTYYTTKIGQLTTDGKTFGEISPRLWKTPLSDIGYSDKIKYVKEISLLSKYDIKLNIFSDSQSKSFNIKGSNLITRIPVKLKGKQIGLSIESTTEKAYVSNLKITLDLLDAKYV